jgi:integrase
MGRPIEKLTALAVARFAKKRGLHGDGGGLYLCVAPPNGCSWVYRYSLDGKARTMGLGPYPTISLAEARQRAADARRVKVDGVDPIERRAARRDAQRVERAKTVTFDWCKDQYIAAHRAEWRNARHSAQWTETLRTYVSPVFGNSPIQEVDTETIMKVLKPLWVAKPETASRVRGRIESILNWATTSKKRTGENPARWRGHLDNLLPKLSKVKKVEHHAALPYSEISAFVKALAQREAIAARALEFLILTGARTGEVLGARWTEIDRAANAWTVPPERMKRKREHRVPLSKLAIAVVNSLPHSQNEFVFPGGRPARPLTNGALMEMVQRMGRSDLTVHGFRATFRTWAAECTAYPREVIEVALAHRVYGDTEGAYQRGDLFEKRRKLMDDWAGLCAT